MNRAYYAAPVESFLNENPTTILGTLADHYEFGLEDQQKYAWKIQIDVLKQALRDISGFVFFEFSIPRMGKRVDVILLTKGIVFVLEFKIGEKSYPVHALEQVVDYALDLKNFHETSHQCSIVPILVSTGAKAISTPLRAYSDQVYVPLLANATTLAGQLEFCIRTIDSTHLDPFGWEAGRYKPTPTIIEAAQALYQGHNVTEITRSDAGAINLSATSIAIDNIIAQAKQNRSKSHLFYNRCSRSWKNISWFKHC